jgi:hypothetical protein
MDSKYLRESSRRRDGEEREGSNFFRRNVAKLERQVEDELDERDALARKIARSDRSVKDEKAEFEAGR